MCIGQFFFLSQPIMQEHREWLSRLKFNFMNEILRDTVEQEINLENDVIFKSTVYEQNFKTKWLQFFPPLIERQYAFSTDAR